MATPRHVLVFRFSALGDVAMTIPVIKLLFQQYPELRITFVSNRSFQPLFTNIDRLHFHPADLKGNHKGVKGLYRLYHEVKQQYDFDAIADLHRVLRTKAIRTLFSFSSTPVSVIDKGRKEKNTLTRKENKLLRPLRTTYERYTDVFTQLGLPVQLKQDFIPFINTLPADHRFHDLKQQEYRLVGIAPFAKHNEKMYPTDKMKEVIRQLSSIKNLKIFLFGGGGTEAELLKQWEKELPGTESLAGKMKMEQELEYIAHLDLMLSMDSANMHLASLYGIPVVSIWGATHPYLGFYGWGQPLSNAVQVELFCRPCSVFGNKPCYRHNLECMYSITPEMIAGKVNEVLSVK